jgi:hypothetical protein
MSFYRDKYLRSEDWRSLRAAKLDKQHNRCQLCGFVSESNDVHHVKYKKLFDVMPKDLVVVCRACHEKIHALLKRFPAIKKMSKNDCWKNVRLHLTKNSRIAAAEAAVVRHQKYHVFTAFAEHKNSLVERGYICKNRMKWRDSFWCDPRIIAGLESPESLIQAYIDVTLQDPRRLVPAVSTLARPLNCC